MNVIVLNVGLQPVVERQATGDIAVLWTGVERRQVKLFFHENGGRTVLQNGRNEAGEPTLDFSTDASPARMAQLMAWLAGEGA